MYSFSERHVKQMEAIFAELRRRERIEGYLRVIRKVAIIVIAVLAVVFASVKFVPEVYEFVGEVEYKTGMHIISYRNADGTTLKFEYRGKLASSLVSLNTEGTLVEEVDIADIRYYIFECEGRENVVIWESGEVLFKLKGVLEKTQIIDIASYVVDVK